MNKNLKLKEYRSIGKFYNEIIESSAFEKIFQTLKFVGKQKRNIFFCGNGGSAANANHASVDLNNIHRKGGSIKFQSISLCSNTPMITAIANDFGFEKIFTLQLEDLGKKGDVLFVFSVSGLSKNVLDAAKYCKKKGIKVISIAGFNGSKIKRIANISISINSKNYGMVEDLQMNIIHSLCEKFKFKI